MRIKVTRAQMIAWASGIVFLVIATTAVNWFIYPFSSANPNYADVEAVFDSIQIPGGWIELDRSENRGIAGRQCPIESESMCFHKAKTFQVPSSIGEETTQGIIQTSGCTSPVVKDQTYSGEPIGSKYSLDCMARLVRVSVSVNNIKGEVYVRAKSR